MLSDAFGPTEGTLTKIWPVSIHGLTFWDIDVTFDDGRTESVRLGPEGVAKGLEPGGRVRVTRIGTIVAAIAPLG